LCIIIAPRIGLTFCCAAALLLASAVCITGCGVQINAGFPEIGMWPAHANSSRIGVARVRDSRSDHVAGPFDAQVIVAGSDLRDYVERTFRNGLVERGYDPVDALDPSTTSIQQPYKVVVLTVQSANFGVSGIFLKDGSSAVDILVQVYSASRSPIYAGDFNGTSTERMKLTAVGLAAGGVIAKAADAAIDQALANPQLQQALK
jgi:hypothetical protein